MKKTAIVFLSLASVALLAAPAPEKEACMAQVREQYRAAQAECNKKPFGGERTRCRDQADRAEARGREACRKLRPDASPFSK